MLTACIAKRSRLQRHKGACQTLQGAETIAAAVAVAVCALSCTPVAVPADTPLAAAAGAAGAGVAFAAAIGARYLQLIPKLQRTVFYKTLLVCRAAAVVAVVQVAEKDTVPGAAQGATDPQSHTYSAPAADASSSYLLSSGSGQNPAEQCDVASSSQ